MIARMRTALSLCNLATSGNSHWCQIRPASRCIFGDLINPYRGFSTLIAAPGCPPSEIPRISERISLIYRRELPLTSS